MRRQLKTVPEFSSEAEERAFWETVKNESAEPLDWNKARLAASPRLRPPTETISLRMPQNVLDTIRNHARKLDVPYQSLIKLWCAERAAEIVRASSTAYHGSN